jgi:hypothetical protein
VDARPAAWQGQPVALLRSTVLAFVAFVTSVSEAAACWALFIYGWVGVVQPRLPDGWRHVAGKALFGLAVLSSLGLYFVDLARRLVAVLGLAPAEVPLYLFTAGLVPLAVTLGLLWLAISRLRIGW